MTITCPSCLTENPDTEIQCIVCGNQLQPQTNTGIHLPPGTTLKNGLYEIVDSLGEGGFGITYKGRSPRIPYPVAIKELLPERSARQGKLLVWSHTIPPQERQKLLYRYRQEAAYLRACQHPSIVEVHDWFQENDTAYMVMRFIQGKTFAQVIKEQTYLPETTVRNYAIKIALALEIAHNQNLLHRDIKPDNIIINDQRDPVLIDFGSAREFTPDVAQDLTQYVTPGYAPPEQYSKISKWGPYTDFYALCATLYEAITGIAPPDSISRLQQDTLIPPRQIRQEISPMMDRIIMEGLKIDSRQRYQSTTELLDELQGRPRLLRRAREAVQAQKLSDAVQLYEQCLHHNPELAIAAIEVAMVHSHLNPDPQTTLSYCQRAIQLAPKTGELMAF
ncbi:MAG: protein kinase [Synechococcaceae cyanobacterium SM2_3_2]|nr:protein kinase [Synechococcaceae cyanobacterium SM2_3_2]